MDCSFILSLLSTAAEDNIEGACCDTKETNIHIQHKTGRSNFSGPHSCEVGSDVCHCHSWIMSISSHQFHQFPEQITSIYGELTAICDAKVIPHGDGDGDRERFTIQDIPTRITDSQRMKLNLKCNLKIRHMELRRRNCLPKVYNFRSQGGSRGCALVGALW
ncbi:hypothetical protein F5Y06DRAFT_38058 [Hypoxylon sp. FL0890]|nr:hypothetical protein F5Y06DRAFT_38058 [Hypoxylon sp. FL0890]